MKRIKKIQIYQLDYEGNKIDAGKIEYFYDEQQRLTHKKKYDKSKSDYLKIITYVYDKSGNEIVRKTDTMNYNSPFLLTWNISTYDEQGKIIKEEGCLNGEDEKYENLYRYGKTGNLLEEVWTKGTYIARTKYKKKGELYEGICKNNSNDNIFKTLISIKTKRIKNVLTEMYNNEGDLLYRDLHEDFDTNDMPGKRTTFRAEKGTTITEQYKRDPDGNLLEKNVYLSFGEIIDELIATEVREIEYY